MLEVCKQHTDNPNEQEQPEVSETAAFSNSNEQDTFGSADQQHSFRSAR
jgi:hypothetical protein